MKESAQTVRPAKETPVRFTIVDRLRVSGQRLRVDEAATRMTFALAYRARHTAQEVSR